MFEATIYLARYLNQDVLALWIAAHHIFPQAAAKILTAAVAAFVLSRVNLIPDFIRVLRLLDDNIIVPYRKPKAGLLRCVDRCRNRYGMCGLGLYHKQPLNPQAN